MVECMAPGAGVVANHLMHPKSTVYRAGNGREPGVRGWGLYLEHKLFKVPGNFDY